MYEGVKACARLRGDVAPICCEVICARIAGGNAGGCACVGNEFVSRNADGGPIRKDVRVEIDKSRRHEFAGRIE